MSRLLDANPFGPRDDDAFLDEMNALTTHHIEGCAAFRAMWPEWTGSACVADLPYVHVGLFKNLHLRTEGSGVTHQRELTSSATTGSAPSRIALDERSSELQAASSLAILRDLVGDTLRPLVVLDDARALRRRGEVTARVAAAMSLRPLASEIHFVVDERDGEVPRVDWDRVRDVVVREQDLLVYGFTWMLWQAWAEHPPPADLRPLLAKTRVAFVHSGGWKRLESIAVGRARFDGALLEGVGPGSRVVDYYGLVEQVGVIYPLCEAGFRHVPRWAQVLARDPWTGAPLRSEPGLLQSLNVLAHGAPYHSVLTEDLARLVEDACPCGRAGTRFELLGRIPRAEIRGCANV